MLFQGQESNAYFQEKEFPIQLCVTKAGEKIKNTSLFSEFVLSHQMHKVYPRQSCDLRSTSLYSFLLCIETVSLTARV